MEDIEKYADIIGMEHPEPKTHRRMSEMDRAAQFAPFSALAGYDELISEKTASVAGSEAGQEAERR